MLHILKSKTKNCKDLIKYFGNKNCESDTSRGKTREFRLPVGTFQYRNVDFYETEAYMYGYKYMLRV